MLFHITGIKKGSMKDHLKRFALEIGEKFYGGGEIATKGNWLDAFDQLMLAIEKVPKIKKLFYFSTNFLGCYKKSKLLQATEYFIDTWVNDQRLKFAICGSSASWILENIINNKEGLDNRVTKII